MHHWLMRTHTQIIAAADCSKLAELSGASIHTVRSWGRRNSIPPEHWSVLIEAELATLEELFAAVPQRKSSESEARAA